MANTLRAAGFKASSQGPGSRDGPEGFVLQLSPDGRIEVKHPAVAEAGHGVPPWDRAGQMLEGYARALRSAGCDITRTGSGSLTEGDPSASDHAGHRADHGGAEPVNRTMADRAAIAASAA